MYLIVVKQADMRNYNKNNPEDVEETSVIREVHATYKSAKASIDKHILEHVAQMIQDGREFTLEMQNTKDYDAKITDRTEFFSETQYAIMSCDKAMAPTNSNRR